MKGIFIYGFTKTEKKKKLDLIGVGNPRGRVQILNYQDLGVIVSESTFKTYQALPKQETIKDLVVYQKVLETLMKGYPLVPVKFGTMVKDKKEALTLLDKGYFRLKNEFRKTENRIELDVVVTWALQKIVKDIYQKSKAVQKLQKKVEKSPQHQNKVRCGVPRTDLRSGSWAKDKTEAKLALGKLIDRLLRARKTRYNKAILKALKGVSVDFCLHALFDETVIFNGAFLVEEAKERKFGEALEKLDKDFSRLLDFRCVGPLPFYSFSTAEVLKIDPKKVEKAKKVFELEGVVTYEKLKRAYRKLALLHHPDKNEGRKQKAFVVINSAYRLLKEYLKNGYLNIAVNQNK